MKNEGLQFRNFNTAYFWIVYSGYGSRNRRELLAMFMRVVVSHTEWVHIGGAEYLDVHVVKALLETGHRVAIASVSNFDKGVYRDWYGMDLLNVPVYYVLPRFVPAFTLYQRLLFPLSLRKAIKKEKPDVVFVDTSLYAPVLGLRKKYGFRIVEYIHVPAEAADLRDPDVEPYLEGVRSLFTKYKSGYWKYYYRLYQALSRRISRSNPFESADLVLVNSRVTAKLVKALWGGDPQILYPPVKVEDFEPYGGRGFEARDKAVVMIGRVAPEKRYEDVVEAVALTKSKPVLRIVGGFIEAYASYRKYIEDLARSKGVKVEFHLNVPRVELVRIAASSRVFVHAMRGEQFGIAVVEAMSAGLPVVVYRWSGPCEDIAENGAYGLCYEDMTQLSEFIDMLLTDEATWRRFHELSLRRAQEFSYNRFAERLLNLLQGVSK